MFVGENTSSEGGAVVASEANKHDADLWHLGDGLDGVGDLLGDWLCASIVEHWNCLLVSANNFVGLHDT